MKKRILALMCAVVLGGSLAACGSSGGTDAKSTASSGSKAESSAASSSHPVKKRPAASKWLISPVQPVRSLAAELVNQFTPQAEQYKDTFTLDTLICWWQTARRKTHHRGLYHEEI